MITIKQVRSGAGKIRSQIQSLKGLGFRKLYQTVQVEDTPSVRGMIKAVQHLVKIINQ